MPAAWGGWFLTVLLLGALMPTRLVPKPQNSYSEDTRFCGCVEGGW
jgi:hypothetical protein